MNEGMAVVETRVQALALSRLCHRWMRERVAGYAALRWDVPKHRERDGQWAVYVDERVAAALPQSARDRLEARRESDQWQPEEPQIDEL